MAATQTRVGRALERTVLGAKVTAWLRGLAFALLLAVGPWSHVEAGWNAYTSSDAGFNSPTSYANERTIDFSTGTPVSAAANNTLTTEQTAGRLTFSTSIASGASFTQTDTTGATGMSGKHVKISSGTSGTASSLTVTFANGGTSYVAFDWYLGLKDQNGAYVTFNFSDGTSQTLYSCDTSSNSTCLGAYVPSNFLTDLFNLLTLCLFGCNQLDTVYLTYLPATGIKITSVTFYNNRCDGCGFLGFPLSQDMYVDNLIYVDPTVAPHHLEVTTASNSAAAGGTITFTVKSCADAACSTLFTTGMTGTLSLTGSGMTPTYPAGQTYSIGARSSSTTLSASITPSGTATVALSAPSITPTGSPSVYCGIGVAAASGNACTITVLGLHHLEVTTASSSGSMNSAVTYTIKACADAACSTTYTSGVTGTFTISGVTVTPSASQAFSIGAGSATTTVSVTPTSAGTATVSLSGVSPTPSGSPSVYCGMGGAAASGNSCGYTSNQTLDHVELTTGSSTNVTCTPVTYTVKACGNAACSTLYTTGLTGTLTVSGVTANYPSGQGFTISNGSSSTTVSAALTTVGTATAALSGLSVTPLGSPSVYCGMGASATSGGSCAVSMVSSALYFTVPNHLSDASQSVTVSAVQSSNNATVCTPAFASVSKNVTFKCTYTNPTTGTLPVRVGGSALNASNSTAAACDGTGRAVSLSFNASGVATTTVQYADVGQMNLTGTYTGSGTDAGLSMTGSSSFIASPASFAFSSITAAPVAGSTFSATLTAKNSSGNAVPNFGKETAVTTDYVRISWAKAKPTGSAAVAGTFTGTGTGGSPYISSSSFSSGVVTLSDLKWTEVGIGDLTATLVSASYLGSGTAVTGTTGAAGAVGPFIPHHFDTAVTQSCSSFTYSGQPYTVQVTARNALNATTYNYDGTANTSPNYAKAVTLSATGAGAGLGSLTAGTSVSASSFGAGVASTSTPTFTFTSKLTSPTSLVTMQAVDTSGVSSASGTQGSVTLRSGRLKVSNAFGSEKSTLSVPVQAQYWNGKAWVVNSSDSCTSVPAASVVLTNYLDYKGAATAGWATAASVVSIGSGNGTLTLSAPSPTATGSVDFAFNLGATTTDQSCLSSHPASTAASLSWLRAQNGSSNSCSGVLTYDRDPSARATFGVYKPESTKTVFSRDIY